MSIKARVQKIKHKMFDGFMKKTPIVALHQTLGFIKEMPSKVKDFAKSKVTVLHESLKAWKGLFANKDMAKVAVESKERD